MTNLTHATAMANRGSRPGAPPTLALSASAPSKAHVVDVMEREISSSIAGLVNRYDTHKNHPTYGVTKTSLREGLVRLDGMVALYAVVTDQANFNTSPAAVTPRFVRDGLESRLDHARTIVRAL